MNNSHSSITAKKRKDKKPGRLNASTANSLSRVRTYVPNQPYVVRMVSSSVSLIATSGAGIIPPSGVIASSVRTAPAVQWVDFSNRFNQYIILSMKIHFYPINNVTYAAGGVAAAPLFCAGYTQGVVPTLHSEVVANSTCKTFCIVGKPFCYETKRSITGGSDADSWTPTTSAVPSDQDFNISLSAPVSTAASVNVLTYWVEWMLAFKNET